MQKSRRKSRRSKTAAGVSLLPNYSQESKKSKHMYDFYFLNYFAYYICKVKGEGFQRLSTAGEPSADSITKTIFIF